MSVITFVDVRIRLFGDWLSQESAQGFPPIAKMMFQQPVFRHDLSHMRIVPLKTITQGRAVLPVTGAIVSEDKDQGIGVGKDALTCAISLPMR